jgi:O-methyltransferase involved in polyketide biosynthesis
MLIFVPVDFERDDVGDKLVAAGFQQNSPPCTEANRVVWTD